MDKIINDFEDKIDEFVKTYTNELKEKYLHKHAVKSFGNRWQYCGEVMDVIIEKYSPYTYSGEGGYKITFHCCNKTTLPTVVLKRDGKTQVKFAEDEASAKLLAQLGD